MGRTHSLEIPYLVFTSLAGGGLMPNSEANQTVILTKRYGRCKLPRSQAVFRREAEQAL